MEKLKQMSVVGLKALAYDILSQIENNQRILNSINQEIASRPVEKSPEPVAEEKKK
jgi:hypothetical protein